jgi:hypothetical protein
MLRFVPRLAGLILIALLPLGVGGCAESGPMAKFTDLMKGYDKTLTKEQQKAAIADMESAQVKHEDEARQDTTGSAPTPAQTPH